MTETKPTAEEIWTEAWDAFKKIHGSQEADIAAAAAVIDREIRAATEAQKERDAEIAARYRVAGMRCTSGRVLRSTADSIGPSIAAAIRAGGTDE